MTRTTETKRRGAEPTTSRREEKVIHTILGDFPENWPQYNGAIIVPVLTFPNPRKNQSQKSPQTIHLQAYQEYVDNCLVHLQTLKQQSSESTEAKPQLNPAATSFYPGTSHLFTPGGPYAPGASRVIVATSGEKSDMSEFARFMVSRELINTSLTKFDDRAESYRAWKATFKAAIANVNFTAEQELDLLIKWLGPGSTNRIKSLRTVYVGQAEAGLAAAWQRLDFGSAEAIEKALFKRLQDIPKINLKEVHKLQDLSDLLMELELAKRDPRLSGLCYLDTAHGVNPIVVKLPYSLQQKWAMSVSRYKRVHDVTFPPFIQFCKFINEQTTGKCGSLQRQQDKMEKIKRTSLIRDNL
ncbi:LOW QUALITY PROTEIN: uncharacterized protein ACNLHF_009250 [Anomaloglossus baeobatrachus]